MAQNYCTKCGAKLKNNNNFCTRCGAKNPNKTYKECTSTSELFKKSNNENELDHSKNSGTFLSFSVLFFLGGFIGGIVCSNFNHIGLNYYLFLVISLIFFLLSLFNLKRTSLAIISLIINVAFTIIAFCGL